MKVIQYFRYKNLLQAASLVMAHEEATKFYDEIELWTDEEGMKLLKTLPVSWSTVNLLPENKSADKATIFAAQNSPFILLKEYVFVMSPLNGQKVDSKLFVYSTTKDAGTEYIYHTNICALGVASDIVDWRTEHGFNAAISGGTDYLFWKEYGRFVIDFLAANKRMIELPTANFEYLVDSWLLKAFAKKKKVQINVLETDPKRIHEVRSTASLLRFNMQLPVVIIPPSMLVFEDIQDFIFSLFQLRHPQLCKEFSAPKGRTSYSVNQMPASEFQALTEDALQYENRRARLLNKIHTSNVVYNHQDISLQRFRETEATIVLVTSKLTDVVKTKWEWRRGVRVNELNRLKWLANAATPPSHPTTLLSAKPGFNDVAENSIDDLNELILEVFTIPHSLRDAVDEIKQHFDAPDDTKLFDAITLRIFDLYKLSALEDA